MRSYIDDDVLTTEKAVGEACNSMTQEQQAEAFRLLVGYACTHPNISMNWRPLQLQSHAGMLVSGLCEFLCVRCPITENKEGHNPPWVLSVTAA